MIMPFLSSLLTYFGGHNSETSKSGEGVAMNQKSDVVIKKVDGQEEKLCNMKASTYDSCHASKENENICNLVCDDIMGLMQNGKETTIKNGEMMNNECNKQLIGVKISRISGGSATLRDDFKAGEDCGQIASQFKKNDKAGSSSDISETSVEVDNYYSNIKVKSPILILKNQMADESSSEVNGLASTLSYGVSTVDSGGKSLPEIKHTSKDSSFDLDGSNDITDSSIGRSLSNEIETMNKAEIELDNPTASEKSAEYCHGNLTHLRDSLDSPSPQNQKNEKRHANNFPLSNKSDNQGCNDGICSGDLSYSHQNESKYSAFDKLAPEDLLSYPVYSGENANEKSDQDGVRVDNSRQSEAMEVDSKKGLTLVDESSNLTNSSLNSVITQNMVDEEERYETEDKVEAEKQRMKVVDNLRAAPEDKRFNRLKNLLDRSNVYAQFLLKRMDQQREQEKARRETKEKAKEKRDADSTKQKEENQVVPNAGIHTTRSGQLPAKGSPVKSKAGQKRKRKALSDEGVDDGLSKRKRKRLKKEDNPKQNNGDKSNAGKVQDNEQIVRRINGEIVSDRQPLLVTGGVMRGYQIDGMEWMRGLFENGINGILADEMGLGKTLQCISLLSYFIERGMKGPFLIAAPLSTLPNWVSEFKKFTPKVKTLLYHGTKDERVLMRQKILKLRMIDDEKNIKAYPVLITSYEIIMRDRAFLNIFPWKYIIIDEGHRIKNLNCRLIRELKTYNTANRLLLTGTPLQNNLAELWSLLNFLLPDIFDDLNSFQEWFDFSAVSEDGGDEKLIAQEKEEHVLETLHAILTPFLLRRLKTDVDLTIPPKRELIVYAPLTAEQQDFYKGTLDRTILNRLKGKARPEPVVEYTNSGRPKRKVAKNVDYKSMLDEDSETFDFSQLLEKMIEEEERKKPDNESLNAEKATSVVCVKLQNVLMQLRKCCNHPYLLEYPINPDTQEYIVDENLVRVSGKMKLLDQMLPELKKQGHKVLIFSQMTKMLDIIEDFCFMRHYSFSRIDGTMKVPERQEMIESFNNDPEVFLFLLSTRAGGLGLNLSSADTCIIYDSDWNPQVDLQAQDRCHRIGQTKPVLIFRFVTANSIDETVVDRAASKRKLEKMVIHKGRFKGKELSSKLSTQDLLELLQSKDHSHVSNISDDFVISKESLNQILDRSTLLSKPDLVEQTPFETDLFKVVQQSQEDTLF